MTMETHNLWILTEERPKREVLQEILTYFAEDHKCGFFGREISIIPILDENKCFAFTYEVIGFNCARVNRIFVKTVSGASSFTDYLIFYQDDMPLEGAEPLYAIEETKTDDQESRNTGVYQRSSKFVFLRYLFPNTKMVMLYSLHIPQKEEPTETYIFGTRLLLTLGVTILGKKLESKVFVPFTSVEEIIKAKNSMRLPKAASNVPIIITKTNDNEIEISGRLFKNNSLAHDPNIGALSIIAACLRKVGWTGTITITRHGLNQNHVGVSNKFVQIANQLDMRLQGLTVPKANLPQLYWHYDRSGEKLGTIFIHIVVENFTESYSIFENHAGCEKSYFRKANGELIPLAKYYDREAYKAGDKDQIIFIPDLVLLDIKETEIITIEGKKYQNRRAGIKELANYDSFDKLYLKPNYPQYSIVRTVVLYGSTVDKIYEVEIGFLLNQNGKMALGIKAPRLFMRAIQNLLDYWN